MLEIDERSSCIGISVGQRGSAVSSGHCRRRFEAFRGTRVRSNNDSEIAKEANYTNPALFKFFPSKDALGSYIFEKSYRELVVVLETVLCEEGALDVVMTKWGRAYMQLVSERLHALLFVHENLPRFWPRVARKFGNRTLYTLMTDWIARGRKDGGSARRSPFPCKPLP